MVRTRASRQADTPAIYSPLSSTVCSSTACKNKADDNDVAGEEVDDWQHIQTMPEDVTDMPGMTGSPSYGKRAAIRRIGSGVTVIVDERQTFMQGPGAVAGTLDNGSANRENLLQGLLDSATLARIMSSDARINLTDNSRKQLKRLGEMVNKLLTENPPVIEDRHRMQAGVSDRNSDKVDPHRSAQPIRPRQSSPEWPDASSLDTATKQTATTDPIPPLPVVKAWYKLAMGKYAPRYMGFPFNHYYTGEDLQRMLNFEGCLGVKGMVNLALANPSSYVSHRFTSTNATRDLIMRKKDIRSGVSENIAVRFFIVGSVAHATLSPGLLPKQKNQQICVVPGFRSFPRLMACAAKIIGDSVVEYRNTRNILINTFNTGLSFSTMMISSRSDEGAGDLPTGSAASSKNNTSGTYGKNNKADNAKSNVPRWSHVVLPSDATIPLYDGTKPFNLTEYQDLPVVPLDDRNRLQAKDVVLVVFTLGHYSNKDFRRGPGLSFNIQDAILLCRVRDHHPEDGEVCENGEFFPVTVPKDVRGEFDTARTDVGDPIDLRDRLLASTAGEGSDDVHQGVYAETADDGDDSPDEGRTVIFL